MSFPCLQMIKGRQTPLRFDLLLVFSLGENQRWNDLAERDSVWLKQTWRMSLHFHPTRGVSTKVKKKLWWGKKISFLFQYQSKELTDAHRLCIWNLSSTCPLIEILRRNVLTKSASNSDYLLILLLLAKPFNCEAWHISTCPYRAIKLDDGPAWVLFVLSPHVEVRGMEAEAKWELQRTS